MAPASRWRSALSITSSKTFRWRVRRTPFFFQGGLEAAGAFVRVDAFAGGDAMCGGGHGIYARSASTLASAAKAALMLTGCGQADGSRCSPQEPGPPETSTPKTPGTA